MFVTTGSKQNRRFLLEWLSFLHRYIPVGVLERVPQQINHRPPYYVGRNDLETLMSSNNCADWIKIRWDVQERYTIALQHAFGMHCCSQGNLKWESIVAAILPSHMEDFFAANPGFLPSNFVKHELPFLRGLKSRRHIGYLALNHVVTIMCVDCTKSEGTITHLHTWWSIWPPPHSVNTGIKRDLILLLNSLVVAESITLSVLAPGFRKIL